MEELRSTEVLEREILEDARKKAHKILNSADDKVRSQTLRWEKETEKDLASLTVLYSEREEKMRKEILARLPLDKRRLRSEITETFLRNALESFLGGLSRQELFLVLEEEFAFRLGDCKDEIAEAKTEPVLYYRAMTEDEAKALSKKVISRLSLKGAVQWEFKQDAGSGGGASFPAVVFDTPELRIIASIENAAGDLLKEKRAELVIPLLGEGALHD